MASYCLLMLTMALELAQHRPVYSDIASKFFEHFVNITDAINTLGGDGLWDEEDGFYYDQLIIDHQRRMLRQILSAYQPDFCWVLSHELTDLQHGHSHQGVQHHGHDDDGEQRPAIAQLVTHFAREDEFYVLPLHDRLVE